MKLLLLSVANFLAKFWQIIPQRIRKELLTSLLILETRGQPDVALKRIFLIKDRLEWVINERALAYGNGVHPKHTLTNYHYFFIDRIKDGEKVLDVGCGYGAVAKSIAEARPNSEVLGLDLDRTRLEQAINSNSLPNLNFVFGDATKEVPQGKWDVIVLSNVLEHIVDRPKFLAAILQKSGARRILIRVPLFQRDWQIPLRQKLAINYFSDDDHKIEHSLDEFRGELQLAGLKSKQTLTLWGEIWAECIKK